MARSTKTPGRPRGRPGGDAELRPRLLDAALAEFARQGIAASTLAGVARAAGTTPALVNYHFGNRDGLVAAVLDERLQPLLARVVERLAGGQGDDPMQRLQQFATGYVAMIAEQPWLARLIVREVLSDGGALRDLFVARIARVAGGALLQAIAAAQAAKQLRADRSAPELAMNLLALLVFPFIAAPVLGPVLGIDDDARAPAALAVRQWQQFRAGAEVRR